MACPGRVQDFSLGNKIEQLKAYSGGGVLNSNPPRQLGGLGKRYELRQRGWGRYPDRPKVFPLFSALRMASPDTLLIVDCHAAIGGGGLRRPQLSLVYAYVRNKLLLSVYEVVLRTAVSWVLTASAPEGMARLSRPGRLVR